MATGELNELYLRRRRTAYDKFIDSSFKNVAITMASMVALILVAILIVVFWGSNESMGRYGLKFLVTSSWNPVDDKYGIATAVYGTIITSLLSLLIAIPLGVGTAVFITENIVPTKIRNIIGVFVELLAAIPSVVLGLWAIFVMVPLLKPILTLLYKLFNWIPFFSSEPIGPGLGITPAILILVVMILPIITAISRDSLNQVPINLREAAYGVGATRWGAITNVILPAALSGITGGVLLALGRAMGETMAVAMIIGNSNNFSWSLLGPGNTIAAMLANQFSEADGIQISSLYYAAFVLMLLTLAVNIISQLIVKRLSLKY